MRTKLSPYIRGDLKEIGDYIAEDNPSRAASFVRELKTKLQDIGRMPEIYRLRPELGRDARLASFGSYVILFRIGSDARGKCVLIERIFHGGRDFGPLIPTE